jgi:hypothetical protein
MVESPFQIGDIVKLKSKYHANGHYAIVIEVNRAESFGEGGWISFDYLVMNEKERLIHITEGCVEVVYSRIIRKK